MITRKKMHIEQLWYTWSTRGLDAIPAGFRVRAASAGLTDIYGQRMEQLSRYLRYLLPPGSDNLNTSPTVAPICLASVRTPSGERALVYKVYTGRDGRNRPGAYFAHMLVGLEEFSTKNAIALWRSSFWQTADDSGASTQLNYTSFQEITARDKIIPDQLEVRFGDSAYLAQRFLGISIKQPGSATTDENADKMYKHLCFFIHAYLLQQEKREQQIHQRQQLTEFIAKLEEELKSRKERPIWDKGRRSPKEIEQEISERQAQLQGLQPPRIIIAAQPDTVAFLIAVLTRFLPEQFTADMTFSTYEHDIQGKQFWNVVGTCLPPPPANVKQHDILPAACYHTELALNTYLSRTSQLADIGLEGVSVLPGQSIVDDFADMAATAIETNEYQELDEFLGDCQELPSLTVREFLRKFYYEVIRVKWLSLEDLSGIFSNPELAKEMLRKHRVRVQIFYRTYRDDVQLDASLPALEQRETRLEHLEWLRNVLPGKIKGLQIWCETNKLRNPPMIKLLKQEALDKVKRDTEEYLLKLSKQDLRDLPFKEYLSKLSQQDLHDYFFVAHELLRTLAPPTQSLNQRSVEPDLDTWVTVLEKFVQDETLQRFALQDWKVRDLLLDDACYCLTPGQKASDATTVTPLLRVKNAAEFGSLLTPLTRLEGCSDRPYTSAHQKLRLPTEWNSLATRLFIDDSGVQRAKSNIALNRETIKQLNNYVGQLEALTEQLLSTKEPEKRKIAYDLFCILASCAYQYKLRILYVWLKLDLDGKNLSLLLEKAELSAPEAESILKDFAASYFGSEDTRLVMIGLVKKFARQLSPERKLAIMYPLLKLRLDGKSLGLLLVAAELSAFEAESILKDFAASYFGSEDTRLVMIGLLKQFAHQFSSERKLAIMYPLLKLRLDGKSLGLLLAAAELSAFEAESVLKDFIVAYTQFVDTYPLMLKLFGRFTNEIHSESKRVIVGKLIEHMTIVSQKR